MQESAEKPIELTVLMPAYNEEQSIGQTILAIKKLLYEDGYTVPGARKFLTAKKAKKKVEAKKPRPESKAKKMLSDIKKDLQKLQKKLENK